MAGVRGASVTRQAAKTLRVSIFSMQRGAVGGRAEEWEEENQE